MVSLRVAVTTMKIDVRQKRRFDILQAKLLLLTGRKMTQDEILDRLLRQAEGSPEALAGKGWRPLSPSELEKALSLPMELGFELGDVDSALYGKKGRPRA